MNTTLTHKTRQPRREHGTRYPALIMLHGRGATEDDLIGLSEFLDERLFIISARAPFRFSFGGGFTWYNVEEVGRPEPKMFAESFQRLGRFFEDVKKGYPIDPARIFFLGFSMGSIMSYALALTMPKSVAGVVANSGYVPEETDLTFQWDKLAGIPFFVAHGVYDPVIPVSLGQRAKQILEQAKVDLTYREYDMGHEINEESLRDMAAWLTDKLDGRVRVSR